MAATVMDDTTADSSNHSSKPNIAHLLSPQEQQSTKQNTEHRLSQLTDTPERMVSKSTYDEDSPPKTSMTEALLGRYKEKAAALEDPALFIALNQDLLNEETSSWQLLTSFVKGTGSSLWSWLRHNSKDFTEKERIDNLLMQKKTAISYQEWLAASEQLDKLQKFDKWKEQKESTLFDHDLIENNLNEIREARMAGDARKLLYLIRTTWTRDVGGIGNVNLYRHSHTGTKNLIDEYLHECQLALDHLTTEGAHDVDDRYTLSMLIQTRKNIGRTALLLSGGGTFGLFHIGVLAALLEEDVLPRIISGSSAGAIVASILCVHNKDEIVELIATIVDRKFDIFDDTTKKEGLLMCLSRFLKYGTWFDSENLKETMREFLGDLTFREAFYRTGKILNIPVSPVSVHEHPRLLNYLTAPSVLIWSAVCASCSLPGVFPSSTIYEKNPKTGVTQEWHHQSVKFVDGSVDNDLPITRLSEMFNVDHIIACQVNPHVVPFLKLSVTCVGGEIETEYSARFKTKLGQAYEIWAAEVAHYLQMAAEVGVSRNLCTKLRSIISQQYSGDITILPDFKEIMRFDKMLQNPSPEFLLHYTMKGARATWPKLSIIKNHCSMEFALDRAIKSLKGRTFKDINPSLALVNSPMVAPQTDDPLDVGTKMEGTREKQPLLSRGKGDFKQSVLERNHHRHRSETVTVGKLKSLRPVKSNISVRVNPESTTHPGMNLSGGGRFRQTMPVPTTVRDQRSYSASNQDTGSFFVSNNFSLSPSEATYSNTSPLHGKPLEGYFRPMGSSPLHRNSKTSLRKSSFNGISSTSSSSDKLFMNVQKKRSEYNNVDLSDGLFQLSPPKSQPITSSEKSKSFQDPEKVDEYSGSERSL